MRKAVLLIAALAAIVLAIVFYPTYVDKPVKDGVGPLVVWIDPAFAAPEYHNPLEWWQTHHMDRVNQLDFEQVDCVYCHEPDRSCNNCHNYVGANEIVIQ